VQEVGDVERETQGVACAAGGLDKEVLREVHVQLVGVRSLRAVAFGVFAAVVTQVGILFDETVEFVPDVVGSATIPGSGNDAYFVFRTGDVDQVVERIAIVIDVAVVSVGIAERHVTLVHYADRSGHVFGVFLAVSGLDEDAIRERSGGIAQFLRVGI